MSLFVSFVSFVKSLSVLVTALLGLKSSQEKLKACRDKKLKKHYVVGSFNPLKKGDYLNLAVEMEIRSHINELSCMIQYHI